MLNIQAPCPVVLDERGGIVFRIHTRPQIDHRQRFVHSHRDDGDGGAVVRGPHSHRQLRILRQHRSPCGVEPVRLYRAGNVANVLRRIQIDAAGRIEG